MIYDTLLVHDEKVLERLHNHIVGIATGILLPLPQKERLAERGRLPADYSNHVV